MANRGILGHYVANASLAAGCYECFDNFTPTPPSNLTLFEYCRRDRTIRANDVWVIAERNDLASLLQWLQTADRRDVHSVVAPSAALRVSASVLEMPWAQRPAIFIERLTTDLWMTHSIDVFYSAGRKYGEVLEILRSEKDPLASRLRIVFVGAGSDRGQQRLFEKLRPHGTYFSQVDLSDGLAQAIATIEGEAQARRGSYQHWYVDGGSLEPRACK